MTPDPKPAASRPPPIATAPKPATVAVTPSPGTYTLASKDGTTIEYDVLGSGPALVIVNGALSVRDFTFARKLAEALATRFTVYNYDRRGRGGSADTQPYAVAREVEDLAALCQAAGGTPFVFGQSSGAALALHAAAAGVPMAGLYAYEPPYTRAHPDDKTDGTAFRDALDAHIAAGRRDDAVAFFMTTVGMPAFMVRVFKLLPMWKVMRGVAHTLPYDARVMDTFDVPAATFANVRVPAVVGFGAKTAPALKAGAKATAEAVPGARLEEVAKSNHGVKGKAILPCLVRAFQPTAGGA